MIKHTYAYIICYIKLLVDVLDVCNTHISLERIPRLAELEMRNSFFDFRPR